MDSGNSSMQSSSCGGGDEEYDNSADQSIAAFLNHQNSTTTINNMTPPSHHHHHHHHHHHIGGPMPNPPQPPPPPPSQSQPPHYHHQTHLDPSISNYFSNSTPLLNLDMVWPSKPVRPETNRPDLARFIPMSSPPPPTPPSSSSQQLLFRTQQQQQQIKCNSTSGPSGDQNNSNSNDMVRNPKKRSRASRRAPTTVLTTDATNFRAMVQEFTGFPAPPFTGSLPFPRSNNTSTGFDLFRSPSYPLRPFAQKLVPPFLSSSSLAAASLSSASAFTLAADTASSSTSLSYQLPSADYQNILNMNTQNSSNPIPNFQPTFADSSFLGAKSRSVSLNGNQLSDRSLNMKMGNTLEGFSHVGTNFGGLQNILPSSSNGTIPQRDENRDENGGVNLLRNGNGGYGGDLPRAVEDNDRIMSYRAAASTSSSGQENNPVAARSEGMVESWICSSD